MIRWARVGWTLTLGAFGLSTLGAGVMSPGSTVAAAVSPSPAPSADPVQRRAILMGTEVSLAVLASQRVRGLGQLERMLQVLEATESELSTWRETSSLSALNRQPVGEGWPASRSLCELFRRLQHWHRATGGAFDPAIGALIAAWDLRGRGMIPSPAAFGAARAQSGLGWIRLDAAGRGACRLVRRRAVTVDAGAFGKGEAIARVARLAMPDPWLIDFGGQVAVGGNVAPAGGWPVAIAHPTRRLESALEVVLAEGALATSGGSERDVVTSSGRLGHILDPRTGRPVARRESVTVWHQDAFVADVLSTALYVMGGEAGLAWAERTGAAALFLVPGDGTNGTSEDGESPKPEPRVAGASLEVRASDAFRRRFLEGSSPAD